jgi:hypothetical protein
MRNFKIRFPNSLYDEANRLAEKNGISLNLFVLLAIAKEIGWQEAAMFYQNMMGKVPYVEPSDPDDSL